MFLDHQRVVEPPIAFGQYDYYLVMYRLARLPEKDVKPLLDERQWKLMRQQFNQYSFNREPFTGAYYRPNISVLVCGSS